MEMGLFGALIIWPIEAAISWATWYAFKSARERIYMFMSQKFYRMIMRPYDLNLLLEDWVSVNRKVSKKLVNEQHKKYN